MHHRLFVAGLVVDQELRALEERLADAAHVAMSEDAEAAAEEAMLDAVAFNVLVGQEKDEGLRGRQSHRRHRSTSTIIAGSAVSRGHTASVSSYVTPCEPSPRRRRRDRPSRKERSHARARINAARASSPGTAGRRPSRIAAAKSS